MRLEQNNIIVKKLACVALVLFASELAYADGTRAGTAILNTATLTFDTSQATGVELESSPTGNDQVGQGQGTPTEFLVDRKIDVEVLKQEANLVQVAPDGQAAMSFEITNSGNATQDMQLVFNNVANGSNDPDVAAAPNGGPDNNEAAGFKICADLTPDLASCTDVSTASIGGSRTVIVDNMDIDDVVTYYVVATMRPTAQVSNGDIVSFYAFARVLRETNSSAYAADNRTQADNPAAEQIVFADGQGSGLNGAGQADNVRDAVHTDIWAYVIVKPEITALKEVQAVWDPVNCDDDNNPDTPVTPPTTHAVTCAEFPKAIPGSYVEYTITVENDSNGAQVDNLVIEDVIDTSNMSFVTDAYTDDAAIACGVGGGCGIYVVPPFVGDRDTDPEPAGQPHTNNGGVADPDASSITGDTVSSTVGTLLPGQATKIKFRVLIQ